MSEKKEMKFEEAILEMEKVVEKLESNDLSLEEALKSFQDGMMLSKLCYDKLNKIEEKIESLIEKEGEISTEEIVFKDLDE